MLTGTKLHIVRNEIHDAPYSGIISGGSEGNVIEENLIYRVMRELHDGAAIYGIGVALPTNLQPAIPYSDYRFLWPIPADEITQNPIITQNPGY